MKSFSIVCIFAIFAAILAGQNVAQKEAKIKILQTRLENSSLKPQIRQIGGTLAEIGLMYPSGNYGSRDGLKTPTEWPELILIAAFLNTECRNCGFREKKLIVEALRNRVEQNYDNKGGNYYSQIFARRKDGDRWIIQFSGVGTPQKLKKYMFYRRDDRHCVENYKAAWEVIINGERTLPCNVTDFLYPAASTMEDEVKRQARNRYMPYDGFYKGILHRFAICKKISC